MVCPGWENFGLGISDFGGVLLLQLKNVKHWHFKCGIPMFYILQCGVQRPTEIPNPKSEIVNTLPLPVYTTCREGFPGPGAIVLLRCPTGFVARRLFQRRSSFRNNAVPTSFDSAR